MVNPEPFSERRKAPRYLFRADVEIEWGSRILRVPISDISVSGRARGDAGGSAKIEFQGVNLAFVPQQRHHRRIVRRQAEEHVPVEYV